ncbi:hypothetical protein FDUTEX481_07213, partial [Tolypothrix sp. PCC 7601]
TAVAPPCEQSFKFSTLHQKSAGNQYCSVKDCQLLIWFGEKVKG